VHVFPGVAHDAATNGQVGGFLVTNIAPLLRGNDRRVLYLGGFDWSANQIESHTRTMLESLCNRTLDGESWHRLALTRDQVTTYHLPSVTKIDKRYRDRKAHEAVETESLQQHVIVRLVRNDLDALLPEPIAAVLVREEQERRRFGNAGTDLRSCGARAGKRRLRHGRAR
jgi:hypothetical protein